MNYVFWQNIISPHQSSFLRSLADLGHGVLVVAADSMTPDRKLLGWNVPDLGAARVVVNPNPSEISHLVEESPNDSVHIMAGARWYPLGNIALHHCRKRRRRIGILTEASDPRGIGGYARWLKYAFERIAKGSGYSFVLAMGQMGVDWFRRCGYPACIVFPFSYVTEGSGQKSTGCPGNEIALLYAGQFITRKGLDILIRAYSKTSSGQSKLLFLGDGPEQSCLTNLTHKLGIAERVTWLPKSGAAGVQIAMESASVSLLPSRHDGWGAVVNESLMVGTPVICSSACGAAELIREPWLGSVFRSGSVADLAKALQYWIDLGPRTQMERDRIRSWAGCIQGREVANYFVAIMEHVYSNAKRPMPPWCN